MNQHWTSRTRVEAALNSQEPDRVPLSMTITEVPYLNLRRQLDLPPDPDLKPNRFGEVSPGHDLQTLGPGGGLILGPVHNVQPDVPPENLLALSQALQDFGHYPL